jgi:hypothetical protein
MLFCRYGAASEAAAIPAVLFENHGQADPAVRFILRNKSLQAYFRPDEIAFNGNVRLRFGEARALQPLEPANGRLSFLIGQDPSKWSTNLHLYSGVVYRDIYPGIDMRWKIGDGVVKSEFAIAPGVDYKMLRLRYSGMLGMRIHPSGSLELQTQKGALREREPAAYTIDRNGRKQHVRAIFRIVHRGEVQFHVAPYDRSQVLVIDPVLSFSTFLGGSEHDSATSIVADGSGNAYAAGWTESDSFPVTGGLPQGGDIDGWVAKFTPSNTLAWCTYIGGSGDDGVTGIAVDAFGNAVLAGYTSSANFPILFPIQAALNGTRNAFVAKLNASGTGLIFSTFLGGSVSDAAAGVALDSSGNIYTAGNTMSPDFPLMNAYQGAYAGQQDGFVTKISASGGTLLYSTFLGGSNVDTIAGIAVDTLGSAYVAGNTLSIDFPVANAYISFIPGEQSGFVTKLTPSGAALVYSTFLGGSGGGLALPEMVNGIAVDTSGAAYVAGVTSSTNFPVVNAFQVLSGGGTHGFAAKLNPAGNGLIFSTYLGGSSRDWPTAAAVSARGYFYVCGYTSSSDFPVSNAIQASNNGLYNAFLASFNRSGALVYATFLGGSAIDSADAIATDRLGNVLLAGHTLSTNFPLASPVQAANYSDYSAFIAKIYDGTPCTAICPPVLVWMADNTRQVTVHYYGGAGGAADEGWSWLDQAGEPGWHLVALADFNGDGFPDLVWQNDSTRQVKVNYYGGAGGTVFQSSSWLNPSTASGWSLVAVADFNGDGVPDLVWESDSTRQITVHYYGGSGGATQVGWNWLDQAGEPGWHVVAAADFNGDGVPDLVWQNDSTAQVVVHYYGGPGGATFLGWNWLQSAVVPGWRVAKAADFNGDGVPDLVWQNNTTRQVVVHYYGGTGGATYLGWHWLNTAGVTAWSVVN